VIQYDETMCRYALGVLCGDLVEELDYTIIAELFGPESQRLLRRIVRMVTDARILSYKLTEPRPAEPPNSLPARDISDQGPKPNATIH
jgi:hypothetical protein